MYTLLILFIVSLSGLTLMIGRKLVLLRTDQGLNSNQASPFVHEVPKIKYAIEKNLRKGGYMATVIVLRLYVQTGIFLKNQYGKITNSMKNRFDNLGNGNIGQNEQRESKFLKMISDYKHKIRHIKNQIKEEENTK